MSQPDPKPKSQIILAPSRVPFTHATSVFLAGSTTPTRTTPWRETLTAALAHLPITILDPFRADWDGSTWVEDISYAPFREQVTWELDMQERATAVVVYFHPGTQAPVSLLELGLCARRGGGVVLVVCPPGYWKRGNVQVVCARLGIRVVERDEELVEALVGMFGLGGGKKEVVERDDVKEMMLGLT